MKTVFLQTLVMCGVLLAGCSSTPSPARDVPSPTSDVSTMEATAPPPAPPPADGPSLKSQLATELAKANGLSENEFDCSRAELTGSAKTGYKLEFTHVVGEHGRETCKARYTASRQLRDMDCSYEYTAHAMGDENSKTVIKALRSFDTTGSLLKVVGRYKETRLRDGKVMRERKLNSVSDETLSQLSKPLIKLADEIGVSSSR